MFERLKRLFSPTSQRTGPSLELAACALMVEAASLDGRVDDAELVTMAQMLAKHFSLQPAQAQVLIEEAQELVADSVQMLNFTRPLKDGLDPDDRGKIIEMLWEVAYADGHIHDYEANLVRRVAGLIFVSDTEAGAARKRVISRLGLNP